jgi:hypothetical protein
MASTENQNDCVICLEPIDDEQLNDESKVTHFSCGHTLHYECTYKYVLDLFHKDVDIICPICRHVECASTSTVYIETQSKLGIKTNRYHTIGFDIENMGDATEVEVELAPIPLWKKIIIFCMRVFSVSIIAFIILLIVKL